MAPLPSNNTGTFYLDYSVEGFEHTMQIRFGTGSSALEAAGVADALLTAISSVLRLITINGARVRDIGTNVTYPVSWGGASTYGSGSAGPGYTALYADFVGRSIDGRRCRISVFGCTTLVDPGDNDYREDSGAAWVAGGLAALETLAECPVSISGLPVNWQQYANLGVNAYWRNRVR